MAEFPIPSFLLNQSVDEIHERMLQELPHDIDKSEGGHPWNLTRPTAYEAAYMAEFVVVEAIKILFPKYAENYSDIMDDHAEMRGMSRKAATHATGEIELTGTQGTEIPAGTSFSTASVNGEAAVEFVTTEDVVIGSSGKVTAKIKAVLAGTVGNVPAGTIILKANRLSGIKSVTNLEDITGGTEAESTEELQARIVEYDATQGVSFVGSEADYKRWSMEVDGIGKVVVIPPKDDSGLITIVLTDSSGNPANEDLCTAVYNHIMRPDAPEARLAPINGGNLLVIPPETIPVTISVIVESDGTIANSVIKEAILTELKSYLAEATADGKVRYTKIGSIISGADGVEDYKSLLLNGVVANITITNKQLLTVDENDLVIIFADEVSPDAPGGTVTQEEIEEAFLDYIKENPLETQLNIDETLKITDDGKLGVNTTEDVSKGNNLPITANAVHDTVEIIDTALEDI